MLCAALVAAASILALPPLTVGPEIRVPSAADAAVRSSNVDVTSDGRDYVAAWTAPDAVFVQKIDGTTGTRVGNVPTAITTGTTSRSAAQVRSNGNGYLVAWTEGQKIITASLDANASLTSTRVAATGNAVSSASRLRLTATGSGYFLVWLEDVVGTTPLEQRIAGLYVDNSGNPVGSPIVIADNLPAVSSLAAASQGPGSIVGAILSGGTIDAFVLRQGGRIPDPTTLNSAGATSLFAIADATGYYLTWTLPGNQPLLASFDTNGSVTRGPDALGSMSIDAVATGANGSVVLGHSFVPMMMRISGKAVDPTPRQLPPGVNVPVVAAAGSNSSYLLVLSTPDLLSAKTTLDETTALTLQPIGVTQPPEGFPRIASGDSVQFVGWMDTRRTDSRDIFVSRFRNGAFLDAGVNVGRGDSFGIAAYHDTAAVAALSIGSPAVVSARFLDASATLSQSVTVALVSTTPGRTYNMPEVTSLGDGNFVAFWTELTPPQFGTTPDVTLSAVTFSATHSGASVMLPFPTRERLAANAAATAYGSGYALAYESQPVGVLGVSMAEFDRNHALLTAPLRLSSPDFPSGFPDIASDGAGHALVVWNERVNTSAPPLTAAIVDLASNTVTARQSFPTISAHGHVTWSGKSFFIVSDKLDVIRMNLDGSIADTTRLTTATPPHDASVSWSAGAGTALVYARPVVDSGAADVDRVQLRVLGEAYPRGRAVKH